MNSAFGRAPTRWRERSPVGGSSDSRSPARRRTSPTCCSSTNRPPASIPPRVGCSGTGSTRWPSRGTTILVTTHYMDEAERCQRLGFLSRGHLIALGTVAEVTRAFGQPSIEDVFIELQRRDEGQQRWRPGQWPVRQKPEARRRARPSHEVTQSRVTSHHVSSHDSPSITALADALERARPDASRPVHARHARRHSRRSSCCCSGSRSGWKCVTCRPSCSTNRGPPRAAR